MKTIWKYIIYVLVVVLLFACSKSDEPFYDNNSYIGLHQSDADNALSILSFKSEFTVWDNSIYRDNVCEGSKCFMNLEGTGTESNFGKMSLKMKFDCKLGCGSYCNARWSFKASNGDELFILIPSGCVVRNEECNSDCYQQKFIDEFIFSGGTGQFEGATGTGWTNAYIHNPDPNNPKDVWRIDVFSTGTLNMKHKNNLHVITESPR